MYVARVLYPVEVLGPGKRVGIWFCGCGRRCKGCSNPELWEFDERYSTEPEAVFGLIRDVAGKHPVEGFTVTGGDPLYQPDGFLRLIALLKSISDDIIVYTGYMLEELDRSLLADVSVLIDGEYVEELNNGSVLRGSSNQRVHILDASKKEKYKSYFETATNKIQNFYTPDGIVSVGIHRSDF